MEGWYRALEAWGVPRQAAARPVQAQARPLDRAIAERCVAVLNEAIAQDPYAVHALMNTRVSCNETLADHPTIQVMGAEGFGNHVGLLGLINGIVGAYPDGPRKGWGGVAFVGEQNPADSHFEIIENT